MLSPLQGENAFPVGFQGSRCALPLATIYHAFSVKNRTAHCPLAFDDLEAGNDFRRRP